MTKDEFVKLQEGDIVHSKAGGEGYVVTGNYGDHVIAVRIAHITNCEEWTLVRRHQPHEAVRIERDLRYALSGCLCDECRWHRGEIEGLPNRNPGKLFQADVDLLCGHGTVTVIYPCSTVICGVCGAVTPIDENRRIQN